MTHAGALHPPRRAALAFIFVYVLMALAPTLWWLFVGLWGLTGPASQGIMTAAVGPSAQGELQGAMGSLAGIAMMIGPTLFAAVFAYSIRDGSTIPFPGASYALAALLLAVAALIAERTTRRWSPV